MLKSKKLAIAAVVALITLGCRGESDDIKSPAPANNNAEIATEAAAAGTAPRQLDLLKDQNRQLTNAITAKDAEINQLKAELASAKASYGNMQTEAAGAKKTKRNVTFIAVISGLLNILFIWLLVKARKSPKRLALPEGRNEKPTASENSAPQPAPHVKKDDPAPKAAEERPVRTGRGKTAKKGRSTGNRAKKNEGTGKRGRPPKKQQENALSNAPVSETPKENE